MEPEAPNVTLNAPVPKRSRLYRGSLARFVQRYPRHSKTQSTPEFPRRGSELESEERGEGARRHRALSQQLGRSSLACGAAGPLHPPVQIWRVQLRPCGTHLGTRVGARWAHRDRGCCKAPFLVFPPLPVPGLRCHLGSLAPCPLGVVSQWEVGVSTRQVIFCRTNS